MSETFTDIESLIDSIGKREPPTEEDKKEPFWLKGFDVYYCEWLHDKNFRPIEGSFMLSVSTRCEISGCYQPWVWTIEYTNAEDCKSALDKLADHFKQCGMLISDIYKSDSVGRFFSTWVPEEIKEHKKIIEKKMLRCVLLTTRDEDDIDTLEKALTDLGLFVHAHDIGSSSRAGVDYNVFISNEKLTEEQINDLEMYPPNMGFDYSIEMDNDPFKEWDIV